MTNIEAKVVAQLQDCVQYKNGEVSILNENLLKDKIYILARVSALGNEDEAGFARYLTRKIALSLGIIPSSIHALYAARGKNEVPLSFTVPAMNLRALSYNAARAVFRAAQNLNAGAFIFEIARSEMGYTDQRPSEYVTSILAAAIAEGYRGPVFIQGDHFQISPKRYAQNPDLEVQAVRDLIVESILAGFFNIDVDTSTLVDLSQPTIDLQQQVNTSLSAELTSFIREIEPEGVTISVGGEIGEVGGHNSTPEELRAYMNGFNKKLGELSPDAIGLSKISIQTGTSHGGVVLPDGSIASVKVDFDTMLRLSRIAREEYGLGGAVQHGASTLPEDAFGKFVESEAIEVHLATNFQNIMYDHLPATLREEMYDYLRQNHADERKEGQTDEQFIYKTRKRAIGPFKPQLWNLADEDKEPIENAWEQQFLKLFTLLGIADTKEIVQETVELVSIEPVLDDYLQQKQSTEDTSDLAD